MKSILSLMLCLSTFLLMCSVTGCAEESSASEDTLTIVLEIGSPMMMVNGEEKEIDPGRGTAPVIVNGRTLVPVRAVIEEMGGSVDWDESTSTAILKYGNDEIRLTIGSTTAYLNGEAHTLDTAPEDINDRTMLPIRFIAESFKFSVDWDEEQQLVTITKGAQATAPVTEEPDSSNQSNAAVVYFSATGNTKALAEKIAAAAQGDLYEIVPSEPYTSEDLNYNTDSSRANQELESDARPEIEDINIDMEAYDVIILGYPIWWGECPPPVRTFLESYNLTGKTIMPFCTSGSSGISGSLAKIRELCPDSTVTEGFRGTGSTTEEQILTWFSENDFTPAVTENNETEENDVLNIQVGETVFTASLADNSSADALKDLLAEGPLTIEMSDYGNFEKVGSLGASLPTNDEQITTEPGDLILYQGNSFVIYYDTNSWNFTRLGKINGVTQEELMEVLGEGDVTVTLSMGQ